MNQLSAQIMGHEVEDNHRKRNRHELEGDRHELEGDRIKVDGDLKKDMKTGFGDDIGCHFFTHFPI